MTWTLGILAFPHVRDAGIIFQDILPAYRNFFNSRERETSFLFHFKVMLV